MRTRIEIRVDRYTRLCLTAIAVLLTVVVVGLWSQTPLAPIASAAGPEKDGAFGDTGARIAAQLEAAQKTNAKIDELIQLLTSGQVKVQVVKEKDDKSPGGANATPPKTR
jgi:hypothetical protein